MAVRELVVYCGSLAKFNEYVALYQVRAEKHNDEMNRHIGEMDEKWTYAEAIHQLNKIWDTVKIDEGVLYWIHPGDPLDGFEEFHPFWSH